MKKFIPFPTEVCNSKCIYVYVYVHIYVYTILTTFNLPSY